MGNTKDSQKIKKNLIGFISIVIIVAAAAIYNYSLHRNFWPDGEYSMRAYRLLLNDRNGVPYNLRPIISNFVDKLVYSYNGFSIQSLRIEASAIYGMIALLTAIPSLYSFKDRTFRLYLIPVFIYLAVVINPGSSLYCGAHTDAFHMYPYDMHSDATLLSLLGINLLCLYENASPKIKRILMVLIIALAVVGYKYSDVIFLMTFSIPLILYGCMVIYHDRVRGRVSADKQKRVLLLALIIAFAAIALVKTLASILNSELGVVSNRGDSGFVSTTEIVTNIQIVITEILALFNVELAGKAVFSIYNVTVILRLLIIIAVLIFVIHKMIVVIKDRAVTAISMSEFVMSAGIIFNLLFLLPTHYGSMLRCIRYMIPVLFYATILVCNRLYEYNKESGSLLSKTVICLLFCCAVLIDYKPFWKVDSYQAPYEEPLMAMVDYVERNNLGDGAASYWAAPVVTALLGGNNIAIIGEPAIDRYRSYRFYEYIDRIYWIIDGGELLPQNGAGIYYGEPSQTYTYGDFTLYYYEDGIPVVKD